MKIWGQKIRHVEGREVKMKISKIPSTAGPALGARDEDLDDFENHVTKNKKTKKSGPHWGLGTRT